MTRLQINVIPVYPGDRKITLMRIGPQHGRDIHLKGRKVPQDITPRNAGGPEGLENTGFRPQSIPYSMRGQNDENDDTAPLSTPSPVKGILFAQKRKRRRLEAHPTRSPFQSERALSCFRTMDGCSAPAPSPAVNSTTAKSVIF
jgi:hypothetical protein